MDLIFPDSGLVWALLEIVGDGLVYHLFTNDVSPSLEDDVSTYTEANWSGYSPITVVQDDFVIQQVEQHVGGIQAGQIAFYNTSNDAVDVWGYFVTDPTSTYLLASAAFDNGPLSIPVGGYQFVTPQLGNFSGLSS